MKTTCPHCNTVHNTDNDAATQPSRRAVMVLIAVIGIAGGWTAGFFCGGILTKPNRQKVNAEIAAIQTTAAADRLAAEELHSKYAELQKWGGQIIFEKANLGAQLELRTEQVSALTQQVLTLRSPPPGGIIHLEEKSDKPPRFRPSDVRIVESYPPDTCRIVGQVKSTLKTYRADCQFTISVFDRFKRLLDVGEFYISTLTKEIPKSFDVTVQAPSADIYYYQITVSGFSPIR